MYGLNFASSAEAEEFGNVVRECLAKLAGGACELTCCLLCYCVTVLLCYCVTVLLCYCVTMVLCYCGTGRRSMLFISMVLLLIPTAVQPMTGIEGFNLLLAVLLSIVTCHSFVTLLLASPYFLLQLIVY